MNRLRSSLAALVLLGVPVPAQESAAVFDAPLVTLDRHERYGVTLDLDNDGWMDAVSWWWTGGYVGSVRVTGWHNDGTGRLVEVWSTTVPIGWGSSTPPSHSSTLRMFTCNLDPDGFTDFYFVTHSYQLLALRAMRSRGLMAPELAPEYSNGAAGAVSSLHAVITDFTGDGFADAAVCVDENLRLREYVAGQPVLVERSSTYPFTGFQADVQALIAIDANGDATPDLCAIRGNLVKLIEVQNCMPTATQTFAQGVVDHHMPAAGDVDGDGDQDLVTWDMSRYSVLRRTGPASWSVEAPVTGGPAEQLVDVDLDGDLDGVCCGGGGSYPTPDNVLLSTMRVSLNSGTGAFAPSVDKSWLGSDHIAGVVDLDHDGDLDVVSGRCILYARGPLAGELQPRIGTGVKNDRALADFDADGDTDYEVGLGTLERNRGDGSCQDFAPAFPAAPPGTSFVGPGWPGDFDGDGDVDLVVRWTVGATFLGQRLLANLGGGAFVDGGPAGPDGIDFNSGVANGNAAESSLAVDADGDGDADLVTRSSVPGSQPSSRFWWNEGGSFSAGSVYLDERVLAIANLNGDSLPDVVTVGQPGTVGVRFQLGGRIFGTRTEFLSLDAHTGRVAVADLDADGDRDVAYQGFNDIQIHWNDGAGMFTREPVNGNGLPSTPGLLRRMWAADVNGDGLQDLLATPSFRENNGVKILLRRADNTGFEPSLCQIVFDHANNAGIVTDLALDDVDGDGDADLVSDRIVRNATEHPPTGGRRLQWGSGTAGSAGFVPVLGAEGPFRVGESAELRVRNACGGANGVLTVSWSSEPSDTFAGGGVALRPTAIFARIAFTTGGNAQAAGEGAWSLPYTVPGYSAGRTKRYQAEIDDPGAFSGAARTNALYVTYGP